jgi:thioredoxin-dependent peroxiredoxin
VRDALAQLNALGTDAVGISPDPVAVQKKFSDKLALNFPLLSDADHQAAEAYGVWGEKSLYGKKYIGLTRSAFLVDEAGRVIEAWPKISPDETVPKALAALERG